MRSKRLLSQEERSIDVHPTAIVAPGAELGPGVVVGPYAVVAEDVVIGPGTRLGPHVVIENGVRMGRHNEICAGAVIGSTPQDRNFQGEPSRVIIGDRNQIREHTSISRATGEGQATVIGNETYIMSNVHIAHNCRVGDRVIIVNGAGLAGYVEIDEDAYIGGYVGVHQFVHIGRLAMIGGFTLLRQDCPPFMLAFGQPARCRGLNRVGLRRKDFSQEQRQVLRRAFQTLYQSGLIMREAVARLDRELPREPLVQELVGFMRAASERHRGVIRWGRAMEAGDG